ncbi:MAG: hypothetical protein ACRDC4_08185, partial [Plesiomonas sp.]
MGQGEVLAQLTVVSEADWAGCLHDGKQFKTNLCKKPNKSEERVRNLLQCDVLWDVKEWSE